MIGTQMKLSSCCDSSGRRAARCRNVGSRLTRGTTIGLPLCDHLAGDAFADAVADRARPRRRGRRTPRRAARRRSSSSDDDAADGAVMAGEDLEHAVQRRLQVERARQRLADFEQRRQAAGFAGRGVHVGPRHGRRGRRSWRSWSPSYIPVSLSVHHVKHLCVSEEMPMPGERSRTRFCRHRRNLHGCRIASAAVSPPKNGLISAAGRMRSWCAYCSPDCAWSATSASTDRGREALPPRSFLPRDH